MGGHLVAASWVAQASVETSLLSLRQSLLGRVLGLLYEADGDVPAPW